MNERDILEAARRALRRKAARCGWMVVCLLPQVCKADLTVYFSPSQVATLVATGATWDTISCEGYSFTYTRDKLFTGGVGLTNPIGRTVRVPWPDGVEAQAVTAGPTPGGARITISRVDGGRFDLRAFTFQLLANTAGAGATLEIMPKVNGEDAYPDPLYFDATGYSWSQFSYDTSSNYLGSTARLTNCDTYVVGLYVDFAITALTLESPAVNHAPTNIVLSNATIAENEPPGTVVGSFSTADANLSDTFTYSLVSGTGSEGNALFYLNGADLVAADSFNYEAGSNYSIRVESADQGLLSTQKVFAVQVLDVNEPVPESSFVSDPAAGAVVIQWSSIANHTYEIHCATSLMAGFTAVLINIPATPPLNAFTDTDLSVPQKYWILTTGP